MQTSKYLRFWSLFIDMIVYYVIMYVMILVDFLFISRFTPTAGDLTAYADQFKIIMHRPGFILVFIGLVVLYEVLMPLLNGGQTLSKKIMKLKVEPYSFGKLLVRALIKIFFVNPSGVVSFSLVAFIAPQFGGIVANLFTGLLILSAVLLFTKDWTLQDSVTKTSVVLVEGGN